MNRFAMDSRGGQSNILHMPAENEPMTQRKLTEQRGIQRGSSSEIFGELEPAGLGENNPCRKGHTGIRYKKQAVKSDFLKNRNRT